MNTSQIKTFAIHSRQVLKDGVINKISSLGFNPDGEPVFGLPQKVQGGTIYAGKILDESFYDAWMALYRRIQSKGIKDVYEEAAYIWFNRLVAIRIMQKNRFIEPVLAYSSEETRIPEIVAQARAGHLMTEMKASDREKLDGLLGDDSRTNEQFALIIENYCRYNPVIFNCFGGIDKYISILLPDNILVRGGFIDLLNHTGYITDEDFTKSELIGWLYQFYIAEKKDEVFNSFKKGRKAGAEDIPAATQIFTPNWIVKYMVQNTLGRTYLDNNPYSTLAGQMKYLVGDKTPDEVVCRLNDLPDYKLIDPACGSGHILVEAFDLLFRMYCEEGYSPRCAIESILTKNIIGIDLDTRAKQLATFALLMKAAQIDSSFLDCRVMPRILDMPSPAEYPAGFSGCGEDADKECREAFDLLRQAANLGSIMKFDMISDDTRWALTRRVEEWREVDIMPSAISSALPSFELLLALTDRYTAVVANPPYMGSGNMNAPLSRYVQEKYPEGKADLFAVFMYVGMNLLEANGRMGMINMQSWMFLASFEKLRKHFLDTYHIDSLLHLGPRTFDELSGEVVQNAAFVLSNHESTGHSIYHRLVDGRNCGEKESLFLSGGNIYTDVSQKDFAKIPGSPVGYWVSEKMIDIFSSEYSIDNKFEVGSGLSTSDNNRFLRFIWEVEQRKIGDKWFLFQKGGEYRKWYGNLEYVVNWANDGEDIKYWVTHNPKDPNTTSWSRRIFNTNLYFRNGITWSVITSGNISFRYSTENSMISNAAGGIFGFEQKGNNIYQLIGALNSKVWVNIFYILNPTINYSSGIIQEAPLPNLNNGIEELVKDNICFSRADWDAHETSWDFRRNPLIDQQLQIFVDELSESMPDLTVDEVRDFYVPSLMQPVEVLSQCYKAYWEDLFHKIHHNEEELNRLFIEIYGLQDELTPEVPLDEITILQQGEISIENSTIVWHEDVIIKQFISYAVGCIMGRYRLDRPGLHIAYPNPSDEDIAPYTYAGETVEIDDDGIIPFLDRDCFFDDNAYNRVVQFIRTAFGEKNLTVNLNYIERCLGETLEEYLRKGFWKDHRKMYRNRPIYWLFSSKKGAFQCLAYMHRMNPYTAEHIRTKYLLKHIEDLKNRIATDTERAAFLSAQERKNLSRMQKDLDECIEYHDRLHVVADRQIGFDLDDGVIVNYPKFGDVLAKIK